MKKSALALLVLATLFASGCALTTFIPKVGTSEGRWIRNTISYDLVYMEGNVHAYRSGGSYYYFKDKKLVKVVPELIAADKI